jgi:hypothetical protein
LNVEDDWGDEEALPAPKYLCTALVIKDYIPETNAELTLILDDIVYVFSKTTKKTGYWEGETKGFLFSFFFF